jgi:endonuclease YncB( thermonuclease family)
MTRRRLLRIMGLVVLALFAVLLQDARGNVVVIDGDGLRIEGETIRLWGIDAPELRQTCWVRDIETPCGEEARAALEVLVAGEDVTCVTVERDRYRRTVARCTAGGRDLAAEMVRQGHALDFARYSGGFYAAAQAEARLRKRGVWAGEFLPPWEWRRS